MPRPKSAWSRPNRRAGPIARDVRRRGPPGSTTTRPAGGSARVSALLRSSNECLAGGDSRASRLLPAAKPRLPSLSTTRTPGTGAASSVHGAVARAVVEHQHLDLDPHRAVARATAAGHREMVAARSSDDDEDRDAFRCVVYDLPFSADVRRDRRRRRRMARPVCVEARRSAGGSRRVPWTDPAAARRGKSPAARERLSQAASARAPARVLDGRAHLVATRQDLADHLRESRRVAGRHDPARPGARPAARHRAPPSVGTAGHPATSASRKRVRNARSVSSAGRCGGGQASTSASRSKRRSAVTQSMARSALPHSPRARAVRSTRRNGAGASTRRFGWRTTISVDVVARSSRSSAASSVTVSYQS